jgi:hypothetical protein
MNNFYFLILISILLKYIVAQTNILCLQACNLSYNILPSLLTYTLLRLTLVCNDKIYSVHLMKL